MAAFTTLALLGLAGAAGLFGGKKLAQAGQQSIAAPGPTTAAQSTLAAPTPPPLQAAQSSAGAAAGQQAAAKQRARLAPGAGTGLAPSVIRAPRPVLAPKTTIAGGY
jgi:hypothetical protein